MQINLKVRTAYGRKIWEVSDPQQAEAIAALTRPRTTVDVDDVRALESLGHEVFARIRLLPSSDHPGKVTVRAVDAMVAVQATKQAKGE